MDKKRGYTAAQGRAVQKYMKNHYDEIKLRVPKGDKDKYKVAAAAGGLSLNQFAVKAMDEKIERDKM